MKRRPFGLYDATLLVVAVALGLWRNRVACSASFPWTEVKLHWSIEYALVLVLPHVAAMTLAVLAMRLRGPRPSLRRLARQPGAAACMVASAVLLVIALWLATTMATGRTLEFSQDVNRIPGGAGVGSGGMPSYPDTGRWLLVYGDRVGFAVAGAWLYLLLDGRRRCEPTWLDRLGRAIGWLWPILAVVIWLRCYSI